MTKSAQTKFEKKLAEVIKNNNDLFVAAFLAEACINSEWGTNSLALFHNYFSLKCSENWSGKIVHHETLTEYTRKKRSNVTVDYRAYYSDEEAIADYFLYIRSYHSAMNNIKTLKGACKYIANHFHGSDSDYYKKLLAVIEERKLEKYN